MLVRLRLQLKKPVVHRFILRRRASTRSFAAGVVRSLTCPRRFRIPSYVFRMASAVALAALVLGPITLTLVSAREAGFQFSLDRIERFSLSFGQPPAPVHVALQGEPPSLELQASDALTGGNIPAGNAISLSESLTDAVADELSQRSAGSSTAADRALPSDRSADPTRESASTGWPLARSRRHLDAQLRELYLWRAWLEGATQFHAKRAQGRSLLIYHPDEGYAVLRAAAGGAYQPMFEPAKPDEESEETDRSVYQDRRERRDAPGTLPEELAPNKPPVSKPKHGAPNAVSGVNGNSF
jgi:hypothetical protein